MDFCFGIVSSLMVFISNFRIKKSSMEIHVVHYQYGDIYRTCDQSIPIFFDFVIRIYSWMIFQNTTIKKYLSLNRIVGNLVTTGLSSCPVFPLIRNAF